MYPCINQLELGIEDLRLTYSLIEYEFGTEEKVWLSGVFRLRYDAPFNKLVKILGLESTFNSLSHEKNVI